MLAVRVLMWVKEQRKRVKDKPASYWDKVTAEELDLYRNGPWYKRLSEAITTAERVLLYTTGFQFTVHTGFAVLLTSRGRLLRHSDPRVVSFFSDLNLQVSSQFFARLGRACADCQGKVSAINFAA